MALIEPERLLAEISPEAPCGEDLSYEPAYLDLERIAQGTEERQVGDVVVPAEEPNWRQVGEAALALLERTRDLRVILYATVAALRLEGLPGLRDGLALLRGALERHWESVHPQLDPDDPDPIERVNIIAALVEPESNLRDPFRFLRRVREAPLCDSRQVGRFGYRDIQIARGEIAPPATAESPPPDMGQIEAAFQDTEPDFLREVASAASEALEHIRGIDAFLTETLGAGQAPNLDAARSLLDQISREVSEQLARRGLAAPAAQPEAQAQEAPQEAPAGQRAPQPLSGEIRSPQDVITALEKICRYYEANEPSSPVPLLLRRAQRLVSKSFVEIIQDLNPDGVRQIELICGLDTGSDPQ